MNYVVRCLVRKLHRGKIVICCAVHYPTLYNITGASSSANGSTKLKSLPICSLLQIQHLLEISTFAAQ